jgi:hypothetical protein
MALKFHCHRRTVRDVQINTPQMLKKARPLMPTPEDAVEDLALVQFVLHCVVTDRVEGSAFVPPTPSDTGTTIYAAFVTYLAYDAEFVYAWNEAVNAANAPLNDFQAEAGETTAPN